MNFQFKSLTIKDFLIAIAVTAVFAFVVFSPKVAPHSWADGNASQAYVCLETNSTAAREEMAGIIQDSDAHLVSCGDWHDFRIVVRKQEYRHEGNRTEVEIHFNVYDFHGNNLTWFPTMSSGPYNRDADAGRRIHNVTTQIQHLVRQNREGYLEVINSL
tara:strand:+ start:9217 stop:9693 length:477 start_codon:yes stop_codon:yes gene_type:complete